jgi:hypothetical protein
VTGSTNVRNLVGEGNAEIDEDHVDVAARFGPLAIRLKRYISPSFALMTHDTLKRIRALAIV